MPWKLSCLEGIHNIKVGIRGIWAFVTSMKQQQQHQQQQQQPTTIGHTNTSQQKSRSEGPLVEEQTLISQLVVATASSVVGVSQRTTAAAAAEASSQVCHCRWCPRCLRRVCACVCVAGPGRWRVVMRSLCRRDGCPTTTDAYCHKCKF